MVEATLVAWSATSTHHMHAWARMTGFLLLREFDYLIFLCCKFVQIYFLCCEFVQIYFLFYCCCFTGADALVLLYFCCAGGCRWWLVAAVVVVATRPQLSTWTAISTCPVIRGMCMRACMAANLSCKCFPIL